MSRIGKKPVKVPAGIKVELKDRLLKISGSSQSLTFDIHPAIKVEYDGSAAEIRVTRSSDQRTHRALHGTTRAVIANMIEGVSKGFQRGLKIFGTGYGVKVQGSNLLLSLGYASQVSLAIPEGIKVDIKTPATRGNDVPAEFVVSGPDKCLVGQFAAEVRKARPPEPYLGKGIRYADEVVKRKAGKALVKTT